MKKLSIWEKILMGVFAVVMLASVTVAYAYTGTATLKWTPPTTFTDGTTLVPATDLSGFKVYTGTASGVYGTPILITGGTATTYTMSIGSGTTYFSITAVGTTGLESVKSAEVSKTVTVPAPGGCTLTVQ